MTSVILHNQKAYEHLLKVFRSLCGFFCLSDSKLGDSVGCAREFLSFHKNLSEEQKKANETVGVPMSDLYDMALFLVEQNMYLDTLQSLIYLSFGPTELLRFVAKYKATEARDEVLAARAWLKDALDKEEINIDASQFAHDLLKDMEKDPEKMQAFLLAMVKYMTKEENTNDKSDDGAA